MKKTSIALIIPFLASCAIMSSPVSFYKCKTGDESVNQSLSKMNNAYTQFESAVNNVDFLQNKEALLVTTKTLITSVNIKIINDKYLDDSGNYQQCSNAIDSTNAYASGITTYLENATTLINNTKNQEAKFKNCTNPMDCQIKLADTINAELSKLTP